MRVQPGGGPPRAHLLHLPLSPDVRRRQRTLALPSPISEPSRSPLSHPLAARVKRSNWLAAAADEGAAEVRRVKRQSETAFTMRRMRIRRIKLTARRTVALAKL